MISLDQITNDYRYPVKGVTFFGSSHRVAEAIDSISPVHTIISESRNFNPDLFNFSQLKGINFFSIDFSNDCSDIIIDTTSQLGFSYGFGVIFKATDIQRFKYGIWNIHSGKLPDIRGRHPVSWGFIRNDFRFWMSIHEINGEIDQGFLLSEGFVHRSVTDTSIDIEEKLELLLANGLVESAFENYFSDRKILLRKGHYYESLVGKFDNLSIENLNSKYVFNIFKSQARYGGIEVEGIRYSRCVFINENFIEGYKEYRIFTCKDGVKVGLA